MVLIDRAELLQSKLSDAGLAGAVVALPQHVFYFSGYSTGTFGTGHKPIPWGYSFFVLGPRRRLLVAPGNQEELTRQVRPGVEALGYKVDSTESVINEREVATVALSEAIALAGLEDKRVGIEAAEVGFGLAEPVSRLATTVPLDERIEMLRLAKDDEEISLIRRAVSILDRGFEVAQQAIAPGVSELDVYGAIYCAILKENKEPFILDATFASGPNTVGALGPPRDRTLAEGDLFLVDLYPVLRMYKGDMSRMFVAGEPLERHLKMHDVLVEALRRAEEMLRPGVRASEPDAIVRKCISELGYGDYIVHHAGHGLGLTHPERPYIAPWENMELAERMVISIEPGIYVPGLGGMRVEQNYVLWADGAEPLSPVPFELHAGG